MRLSQTAGLVLVLGGLLWAVTLVQQAYSEEEKPAGRAVPPAGTVEPGLSAPYKPVAPVHDLMEAQDHFFSIIKQQLRARGKEDFKEIRISANVLAELCNVNQFQKDKRDYQEWATEARDASLKLAEAAKAKDAAAAGSLVREIHTSCTACHDKYQ